MKSKIAKKVPDETRFPHLRADEDDEFGYVYIFFSENVSFNLTCSDMAVRSSTFANTTYFTGSLTLENN